jgi:hypothetical protein
MIGEDEMMIEIHKAGAEILRRICTEIKYRDGFS